MQAPRQPGARGNNSATSLGSDEPEFIPASPESETEALAWGYGLPPAFLESDFDCAWRNRTQEHRKQLADAGITFQAMLRAGDLGVARIATTGRLYMPSPTGFPAVILAVWYPAAPSIYTAVETPEILDLIAFRPDQPETWWYCIGEPGLILGSDNLDLAHATGWPISFATTPLDWLQADCRGACLLDHCEARWAIERFAGDEAALRAWWRTAA